MTKKECDTIFDWNKRLKRKIKVYQEFKKEHTSNNKRIENSGIFLSKDFAENFAVIDDLDIFSGSSIQIIKLNRPVESWMLDKGVSLQYESYAELIASLEISYIDGIDAISSVWVANAYRKQGIASFMIKRTIEWAKARKLSELQLIAAGLEMNHENELPQKGLIKFYEKFGFEKILARENSFVKMRLKL